MDTNNREICNATIPSHNDKRENYLTWSEYFMATALLAAKRSKDPITQVGACIVNKENKLVGVGYNGFPIGCDDNIFPWGKGTTDPLKSKYMYVCHAEMNAILNKNVGDVKGCTIYVTLFPCNECAKLIVQSGISEVVYLSDKYKEKVETVGAKIMFDAVGIKYIKYVPKHNQIVLDFTEIEPSSQKTDDSSQNGIKHRLAISSTNITRQTSKKMTTKFK